MTSSAFCRSSWTSRITDLVVLTASFLMFAYFIDMPFDQTLAADLLLFVGVLFVCLRLARRAVFDHAHLSKRILASVLGNISGLLVGVVLLCLASQAMPFLSLTIVMVVCSALFAFFILGTLAPLIKTSRNDMMSSH